MSETNTELNWLIRDPNNKVRGPFPRSEILSQLKKGVLKSKVELSCANTYWFALEEKPELYRFFPELGTGRADESPTQMTATLTQASATQEVEVTQFLQSPTRKDLPAASKQAEEAPKAEWLDPEMAAEFGADMESFTASVQVEMESSAMELPPAVAPAPEPSEPAQNTPSTGVEQPAAFDPFAEQPPVSEEDIEATQKVDTNQRKRSDPRKTSQSKADALPSELLDYQGARPKPMDTLFRNADRSSSSAMPAQNMITVPVESHESSAQIIQPEVEDPNRQEKIKKILIGVGAAAALAVVGAVAYNALNNSSTKTETVTKAVGMASEPALKKALLLFDLDSAKDAISEYELSADSKAKPILPLSQAILRKEFLFDTEGALGALQMAKSLAKEPKIQAEIDNLLAIYRFERDPNSSIEELKRLAEANPAEPVFRYNWALSLQRQNRSSEAMAALAPIFTGLNKESLLLEDAAVLLGWARDTAAKGNDASVENAFQRALEANPDSPKGRMGLAIFHLRRGGLRDSDSDFRAFIDSMPELDNPTRVPNYRKMSDFEFYRYAHAQLADLNMPGSVVGNRPSGLIMAADAILSSIQSQDGDANRIISDAAKVAPGEIFVLKAMGYLNWKDGKYAEITDLFKEAAKERSSYAVNVLLGKANLKLGRKDAAEQYFQTITQGLPNRADGWSLLGDTQIQSGKGEDAGKNYRHALTLNPVDLAALRGLNHLKQKDLITPVIARNLPF